METRQPTQPEAPKKVGILISALAQLAKLGESISLKPNSTTQECDPKTEL